MHSVIIAQIRFRLKSCIMGMLLTRPLVMLQFEAKNNSVHTHLCSEIVNVGLEQLMCYYSPGSMSVQADLCLSFRSVAIKIAPPNNNHLEQRDDKSNSSFWNLKS